MAPQTDPLSNSHRAMTQDDCLSLCLHIFSQCHQEKITTYHSDHSKLRFKCSICGKAFSSYHALGGHKSSHHRPVNPNQMKPGKINHNVDFNDSEKLPHRCNVCYKRFASGQALGGHKRCHYLDGFLASGSTYSATTSRNMRDFDLNLPPRWSEEEEVSSPLPVKKQPRLV